MQSLIAQRYREYKKLRIGKSSLLATISQAELFESVYNSNAIENSTLTLDETEKILLDLEVAGNMSLREVFEAKNLARVNQYLSAKSEPPSLTHELILLLHRTLLTNINDDWAGRYRQAGEYVRVGNHIAPAPERVKRLMSDLLALHQVETDKTPLQQVAEFHLEFEQIHPFCDGNGRIGRVINNIILSQLDYPPVIIRFKNRAQYYAAFQEYQQKNSSKIMQQVIGLAMLESLHKRIAYLTGENIIRVTELARQNSVKSNLLLNKAKRQTIPAFRERGTWHINANYLP